jgi:hypothetical protein
MNDVIIFLTWLDESNVAYLVMILCFLVMAWLQNKLHKENIRLRKVLSKAVLGD